MRPLAPWACARARDEGLRTTPPRRRHACCFCLPRSCRCSARCILRLRQQAIAAPAPTRRRRRAARGGAAQSDIPMGGGGGPRCHAPLRLRRTATPCGASSLLLSCRRLASRSDGGQEHRACATVRHARRACHRTPDERRGLEPPWATAVHVAARLSGCCRRGRSACSGTKDVELGLALGFRRLHVGQDARGAVRCRHAATASSHGHAPGATRAWEPGQRIAARVRGVRRWRVCVCRRRSIPAGPAWRCLLRCCSQATPCRGAAAYLLLAAGAGAARAREGRTRSGTRLRLAPRPGVAASRMPSDGARSRPTRRRAPLPLPHHSSKPRQAAWGVAEVS
jgi:hypothetical protein